MDLEKNGTVPNFGGSIDTKGDGGADGGLEEGKEEGELISDDNDIPGAK